MTRDDLLFPIIRRTPKGAELVAHVREGFVRYYVDDCLHDLSSLVRELMNTADYREAMSHHPLAVAVVDKAAIVANIADGQGGTVSLDVDALV